MDNLIITFFAYFIDRYFGEFKFIKHPIIIFGEMIKFFEDKFYKDSIFRGFLLVLFMIGTIGVASFTLQLYLESLPVAINIIFTSLIASVFIAHNMLYNSIKDILYADDKKYALSMLVSRDTHNMDESDIYKASIESYAENLSDGVIAPIFYLLIFNLIGIILYKVVNTMDSMVGYKNLKYEKFGKVAAILDDILNYIPSRLTAILIIILDPKKNIFSFYKDGSKHDSPNAGHPITAMALAIDVRLGGDTYYFKELKHKPYFGNGKKNITQSDVKKALNIFSIKKDFKHEL